MGPFSRFKGRRTALRSPDAGLELSFGGSPPRRPLMHRVSGPAWHDGRLADGDTGGLGPAGPWAARPVPGACCSPLGLLGCAGALGVPAVDAGL